MSAKKLARLVCLIFVLAGFLPAQAQETQRQFLSGPDKDKAVAWQFLSIAGSNSNKWTTIPVPSNWELQGFGRFTYGVELGRAPRLANAVQGQYKHTFGVPAGWSDRRVFLVFEGVMTDTTASINGQPAGPRHQGGYYRFKYEVTKLLKYGQDNLLEVMVDEESSDPSVNAAERRGDYWNYAGIYRPVYLEAVPKEFIDRIAIDARADGSLSVDVFADGAALADGVEAQVLGLDGRSAGPVFRQKISSENPSVRLQSRIASLRLWSAETPNLYQLEVRLTRGATVLHRTRQRFGFRTIEVRPGDGIYVNSARVLLKGVNRHTFLPDSGRASSEQNSRDDILLIRDMNMNSVRMSHYPPDQHFLDACDEMGLYVLDELAGWQHRYDTEIGRKLVEEMVKRDVNHPSILFWDNGNEGGWNTALDVEFAKWDPQQRQVLHPWEKAGEVETRHYPDYTRFQALCAANTIIMPTEIMHGLYDGGAGAGLEDYWNVMRNSKVRGGAFIWSFVDEAVKRVDLDGHLDGRGNLAPDGVLGPYREKEGSYFTIKELWSPVVVTERSLPPDFKGTLTIENRYDFNEANKCSFSWQLRRFRRPGEAGSGFEVITKGMAKLEGSVPPGANGRLNLNLPKSSGKADALALRIDDPAGRELWTWVWPLPNAADYRSAAIAPGKQRVAASEAGDRITVRTGGLDFVFSKQTGALTSVKRDGQAFSLNNGPRLAVGEATLSSLEHRVEGSDYIINATYSGNLKSVHWKVRSNGWLQLDYVYNLSGQQDFFGISFDYPEANVKGMRWLGNGPYRVWKNRLMGGTLNVWENEYNNSITGAGPWKYPEFKGYYGNVRWMQLATTEGPITAILNQDDLFLQVLTPQYPEMKLAGRTLAPFPAASISFLHTIPGMGSKFISAENSGPQGKKTVAAGDYQGSVSFFFGR
jgi:hypothetical protein